MQKEEANRKPERGGLWSPDFRREERVVEESALSKSVEQQCLGWITLQKTVRAPERRTKGLGQGAYSYL